MRRQANGKSQAPVACAGKDAEGDRDEDGKGDTCKLQAQSSPRSVIRGSTCTGIRRVLVLAAVLLVVRLLPGTRPVQRAMNVITSWPEVVSQRNTEQLLERAGPRSRALAAEEDARFRGWLETVQQEHGAYPEGRYSGTGIVFSGGGAAMLRQVMGQIIYLRESLECTLPVEVMHLGAEEMTQEWKAALEALPDTSVVDLYSFTDPITQKPVTRPVGSFTHIKPAVILLSSFEEVIFLDTNNFAMQDPAELFSREAYQRDGYLMWSDLWLSTSIAHEYSTYSLLQVPPPPGFENSESGVMYWNKSRRWKEMLTAWALTKPLASRGTIRGDKQMYGYAFAALGQTMNHTFARASVVGRLKPAWRVPFLASAGAAFQPLAIHQADPGGAPGGGGSYRAGSGVTESETETAGLGFFHCMGITKTLRPFSRHGLSHTLNMPAAELASDFDVLDLSTAHAPYGLGRAVTLSAEQQSRLLVQLPPLVQARAAAAREAMQDHRVLLAFGREQGDLVTSFVAWLLGRE